MVLSLVHDTELNKTKALVVSRSSDPFMLVPVLTFLVVV